VRQDLVDHRGLRDERHNPHRAGALRARERVDLEDLLQQCRPAAGGVGGGQPRRSHDRHGRIGSGGLRLAAHAAWYHRLWDEPKPLTTESLTASIREHFGLDIAPRLR